MKGVVADLVDNSVMIRLAGCYNRQETLPEGIVARLGIADSYCPTDAALVERSDCPKDRLLER
jgi:hypothetical protein